MKIALATLVVSILTFLLWGVYSDQYQESVNDKLAKPITGAFGLTLGNPFKLDMVKAVLGKEQNTYRNKEGKELQGFMLQIVPLQSSDYFQQYEINTRSDGIIYLIEGKYQNKKMALAECKAVVKSIAGEFESIYGKARGRDSFGQWYSFRQISDYSKNLSLYAHRCGSGMYSVIYTDDKLRKKSSRKNQGVGQ